MNEFDLQQSLKEVGLYPHQAAFVLEFVRRDSPRAHLLQAIPGSGVLTAVARTVRVLRDAGKGDKILVLLPFVALRDQMAAMLRETGVPADIVDRYRYREIEAATPPSGSAWTSSGAFVMGMDFAKQPDIRRSLLAESWDLLLVDSVHACAGQRAALVASLAAQATVKRVLMTSSLGQEIELVERMPEAKVTKWTTATFRTWDGKPLVEVFPPTLKILSYSSPPEAQTVRDKLAALAALPIEFGGGSAHFRLFLQRLAASSPVVLEASLRNLRNSLAHRTVDRTSEGTEPYEEEMITPTWKDPGKALTILSELLSSLETSDRDPKLEALVGALSVAKQAATGKMRNCVFTSYVSNISYLESALSNLGESVFVYHGAISLDERHRTISEFQINGGLLIATSALGEGVGLPEVSMLILYDIPSNALALEQLLGRFDRVGRKGALNIVVFQPSGDASQVEQQGIGTVQSALRARHPRVAEAKS